MLNTIIDRLKSPVTLSNIIAAIAGLLLNLGVVDTTDKMLTIANIIIGILITIGVLNNPTDKTGF